MKSDHATRYPMRSATLRCWLLTGVLIISSVPAPAAFAASASRNVGAEHPYSDPAGDYTDPGGYYSITFPAEPERKTKSLRYEDTDIQAVVLESEVGSRLYMLSYSDYPLDVFDPALSTDALDGAVENAVLSCGGRLLIQENVTRQGRPGRKVRILIADGSVDFHLVAEAVLDHNRMYIYGVICETSRSYGEAVLNFLGSFRILKGARTGTKSADTGANASIPGSGPVQSTQPSGTHTYSRYQIKDLGSLEVTDRLEVQGEMMRAQNKVLEQELGIKDIQASDVIFQQKGLNDRSPEGRETYVRIMIRTKVGTSGDFLKLNALIDLTAPERAAFDSDRRSQVDEELRKMGSGATVVSWDGMRIGKAGTYAALHFGYVRKLGGKPPVRVEEYIIQNSDRVHYVTMSYRIEDKSLWQPALDHALKSLKITGGK